VRGWALFASSMALAAGCGSRATSAVAPPPALSSSIPPDASPPVLAQADDASAAQARTCVPRQGSIRLYWLENNATVAFDREALACLSDAERAAVAYVTPTLGSQCIPAPSDDDVTSHLDCPFTTALGLGYQCEKKHREFLQHWLGDDAPTHCRLWPETAYTQEMLVALRLTTLGDRLTVDYEGSGTVGPGGKTWSWSETLVFDVLADRIKLESRKMKGTRMRI